MLSVRFSALAVLHKHEFFTDKLNSKEKATESVPVTRSLGYLHLGSFSNRFFVKSFYLFFTYLCLLAFRAGSRSPAISRVKLLAKMINV